jgi:hypothetical protein
MAALHLLLTPQTHHSRKDRNQLFNPSDFRLRYILKHPFLIQP